MIYKKIHVPNTYGTYIQIKFDDEGVVYDIFDKDDEIIQECGYDFYHELGLGKTQQEVAELKAVIEKLELKNQYLEEILRDTINTKTNSR